MIGVQSRSPSDRASAPPFDGELMHQIVSIGFHPFILVRCAGEAGRSDEFVTCRTQNEAGQFVDQIARLPCFTALKLLRGIERALQSEIYEAAELFFSWVREPATVAETAYIGLAEQDGPAIFYGYPAFEIGKRRPPAGLDERVRLLVELFEAYERTNGNDALRFMLMEGLASGLSRILGSMAKYAEAADIVERALACRPYSIHLKAARHALRLAIEGKPVPPRFENFIGFYDRLLREIERVGFYPFILVRCDGEAGLSDKFIVCETQNEAGQFVDRITRQPGFAESRLLRGIERALQAEIFESAALFFAWATEPAVVAETAYIGLAEQDGPAILYGYPAFEIGKGLPPAGLDERVRLLVDLFEAYERTNGNDALRFTLMEGLASGLSRILGSMAKYAEAANIVDRALTCRPYSIHLKAARHALRLTIEAKPVPPRFEKFIGEDDGYLKSFVCPLPFERFDIGPSGDVLVCCGHWLPTSIGNFLSEPIDGILNSARAQKIRQSVTDGSYKYCNHLECGAMAQDTLPRRDQLAHPRTRNAVAKGEWRIDGVDEIMFAFDQTCNLSCPSCRTHRIVEKVSDTNDKVRAVDEKLLPLLPTLRVLNINPAGELFASKPSRKLLELIDNDRCPNLVLDIISNGTLFSEEEWNKFPGIHGKVRSVRISIDAARKDTFEKLRRLGKYDGFVENMRFLSRLRASGGIPQLKFSFTYQLDNFREMPDFVQFCAEMNADFAIFERLQNIAYTHQEFIAKAVHYPDHHCYAEFIGVIRGPIFRSDRVWHDFDYPGVENMDGDKARARVLRSEVKEAAATLQTVTRGPN